MQLRLVPSWLVALMLVSHAQAVQAETESPRTEASAPAAKVEMGILFGASRLSEDSYSVSVVQLPGGVGLWSGPDSLPTLYLTWLASDKLAIGPELSFGRISSEFEHGGEVFDMDITTLMLGGRAAFSPAGDFMPGFYLLGQGSMSWVGMEDYEDDWSETDYSAGLGMGYQWRLGPAALMRVEGQYRRWFDAEMEVFSLVLGLGTRLGGG